MDNAMSVETERPISAKIRIAMILCYIFSLPLRRIVLKGVAGLASQVLFKHKLIAMHNLSRSFPDKSTKELQQILKKSCAGFATLFAEFPEILNINKDNLHHWVSVNGMEHYEKACREGKGVLLITGHFGNWEIGSAALAVLFRPPIFMARVLDNPFLEEGTAFVRSRLGIGLLHKENAMRPMLKLLKKGEAIELLIDQNVDVGEGVFVDFLGRPACTTAGVALVAMRTGAAVLPIFTTRMPSGKYVTEIGPKMETVMTGHREQDILTNTQNYASVMEAHIRKYPEQWFWLHQRWKTKLCQVRKRGNS